MIEELFKELSSLDEVEAIALGGSRAGAAFDEKSDYDVYLYITKPVNESLRRDILSRYCDKVEYGNSFWEFEDNGVLKNGIDIDILYRDLVSIASDISSVVDGCNAHNCYTTCIWHNVKTCKIVFDRNGRLTALQKRYSCPYPQQLKKNIITRGMQLLRYSMPAFEWQILKAVGRGDLNSINHRTAEFMATYFDIIFAVNELTHPGEKRLVSLCKRDCALLPARFEENINELYKNLFHKPDKIAGLLDSMITELEKII